MRDRPGARGWLPARGVLLHIGPHKTGTTAIQGAFAAARSELDRRGIMYPGHTGQHRMPALAVTNSRGVVGIRPPQLAEWERLVTDVHAGRRKRVVVSSEAFVEANKKTIRRIVEELGGERVHIVMTVRPLAKILPSAWQQMVRNRLTTSYDDWLDEVLNRPPERRAIANFWHRHRHDAVVERWMTAVGPERMAVVVVEDANRLALPSAFEQLLDLPHGFLVSTEARDNRGLTGQEIELVRLLNIEFEKRGWSNELYHQIVRLGAVTHMQTRVPGPDEPKIITPEWAVGRGNELAATSAERIRSLGVLVVGNLDTLSEVAPVAAEPGDGGVGRLLDAGADKAVSGVREQLARLETPPPPEGNARPVESIATSELASIVGDRISRRVRAKLGLGIRRD